MERKKNIIFYLNQLDSLDEQTELVVNLKLIILKAKFANAARE